MDASQWHVFHRQFTQLSQRQRLISIGLLRDDPSRNTGITVIEQAAQAHLQCPACSSTHFHRHGHANQLQRYRCVPCGKTFNALSGTPLAHLRHKERWLAYAGCMLNSFSVRKAAQQIRIHRNTSFRWRHRFLSLAKADRPHRLHGIAEADEMYVLESQKGSRHLTRPARQRLRAERDPRAQRQRLPQPFAAMAAPVSRRGDTLSAQLSRLALDTRCQEDFVARKLAQGHLGYIPPSVGDIAFFTVPCLFSCHRCPKLSAGVVYNC